MYKEDIKKRVEVELQKLPPWLQKAYWMLKKSTDNKLSDQEKDKLAEDCLKGTADPVSTSQESSDTKPKKIVIEKIGNIKNINLLTDKGLSFKGGLNIIYGANGSGKSGYTRILNNACGNEFGDKELKPNIYKKQKGPQEDTKEFTIHYKIEKGEYQFHYVGGSEKVDKELKNANIFDTKVAQQYMEMSRGVKYVPRPLFLFGPLVEVYNDIKKRIEAKRDKHLSEIKYKANDKDIKARFKSLLENTGTLKKELRDNGWNDEKVAELNSIDALLAKTDPKKELEWKRREREGIDSLNEKIEKDLNHFSDANLCLLKEKRSTFERLAKEAEETIKAIHSLPIPKAGSEIWHKMWESAKKFAEEVHDTNYTYPNTPKCMLCQQDIGEEGKGRMESLEAYVKNEANTKADSAKKDYENLHERLKVKPSTDSYEDNLGWLEKSAQKEKLQELLKKFYSECKDRYQMIDREDFSKISSSANTDFSQRSETLKESLNEAMKEIKKEETYWHRLLVNREKVKKERADLSLEKFLSLKENKDNLEYTKSHNAPRKVPSPRSITEAAGNLHNRVAEEFKNKFEKEYKSLTEHRRPHELEIEPSGKEGEKIYRIRIKGTEEEISSILSEGEQRIIALALFLAEMHMGGSKKTPFIFDDPVSSLDAAYQERIAKRLVDLANRDRQVIVFTHRYPFLLVLNQKANKEKVKVMEVRAGPLAGTTETGIPDDVLYYLMGFEKGFEEFKKDLEVIKKGKISKNDLIGMCTQLRNLLETFVGEKLLSDIVARDRKEVMIRYLDSIKFPDGIIDKTQKLNKELSSFMHSTSLEKPSAVHVEF
ncbi:MAG: AAA family ATPase, partial [Cytophagales bacterium]|nr:AAA family ATPase [Cytophagales bacterium]